MGHGSGGKGVPTGHQPNHDYEKLYSKKQYFGQSIDELTAYLEAPHARVYKPEQTLPFSQDRLTIYEAGEEWAMMFGNTRYVNYLSYFTFAKFLRSVQMLRPMRSVLWGGITFAAIRYTR